MAGVFHEGERAVQAHAGVAQQASRVANGIHRTIPPAAQEFLEDQPFAIIGARTESGRVWASPVFGPHGFLHAANESTLVVGALPLPGDPLEMLLATADGNLPIGLLVIEPETRRRMRVNGRARAFSGRVGFAVNTEQVYANCPKYIQKRSEEEDDEKPRDSNTPTRKRSTDSLNEAQRRWVSSADTFFIATAHPEAGADASHRGGDPGFVQVSEDGTTLLWPDYSGNTMFNTLGNISVNPYAGLLFLDWEQGGLLQIAGSAEIVWEGAALDPFPGAERAVSFRVEEVVEAPAGTMPLHYRFLGYSPFNPHLQT